jgi:uncharacterized protein
MMKFLSRLFLPVVLCLLLTGVITKPAFATGVYEIPTLTSEQTWVLDQGDVLSRFNQGSISKNLEDLAKNTGNEVRFVTIRRLDYGETIDTFADKLFDKWFPTTEAKSHQTLLILDSLTNTSAIRTGDQVKTTMSDAIAQSVAKETLLVPLQTGDKYNQAFADASDRLVAVLSGQEDPGAPKVVDKTQVERTYKSSSETNKEKGNSTIWVIGLLIAATVIPMVTYFWYQGFSS